MREIQSFKNQHDFNAANTHGKKFHSKAFIAIIAKVAPPCSRLLVEKGSQVDELASILWYGIKVGKKFSKKAVLRNKAKRKIRHMMRELVRLNTVSDQIKSILIIPKKDFHQVKFADMLRDLENLCARVC